MKLPSVRIGLSVAGLALAVVAIALDDTRLTWAAIVVLAVAVAMRLISRRVDRRGEDSA